MYAGNALTCAVKARNPQVDSLHALSHRVGGPVASNRDSGCYFLWNLMSQSPGVQDQGEASPRHRPADRTTREPGEPGVRLRCFLDLRHEPDS
ncbi:DUF6207 family protein [Streptomyces sp. NPDC002701]|uniref:DUF6207 family protein n=1 Tax=Streptomyces sp. NPDC002701 TaxID=3364661 RepID=UPI00367D7917